MNWGRDNNLKHMQPKYKIIIKNADETFNAFQVETVNFLTVKGLPVVSARYATTEEILDDVSGVPIGYVYNTVIIDEVVAWLFQFTGAFDKIGKPIYHGDLLKAEDGILYEVMYAVGSYFIVKDDAPLMLLDNFTRKLEVAGNVIENADLINVDISVLTPPTE